MSIISACAPSSHAQDSRALVDACEKCVDELALARAENGSLKTQISLSNERTALLERLVQTERERGDFFKVAAESFQKASGERATANETDALRITLLRDQIADYKIELDRARREIEKLRGQRWKWTTAGIIIGGVGTYAVTNK